VTVKYEVMSLTIDRVHTGTRLAVSLHQRSVAKGGIGITETCVMSSAAEMHTTGLTNGARSVSVLSNNYNTPCYGALITFIKTLVKN
jgi:hypothetical protein